MSDGRNLCPGGGDARGGVYVGFVEDEEFVGLGGFRGGEGGGVGSGGRVFGFCSARGFGSRHDARAPAILGRAASQPFDAPSTHFPAEDCSHSGLGVAEGEITDAGVEIHDAGMREIGS